MWHACGHTVAPACALIAAQLSPRGLQLACSLLVARLRPHHGLSLLVMPHNSVLTGSSHASTSLTWHARDRTAVSACRHSRAAQPSRAQPCALISLCGTPATVRGVGLLFIAARLSPLGPSRVRSYQLCGTPATAPRRLPALYCHPSRPSQAAAVSSSYYVVRLRPPTAPACALIAAQLTPRGLQPCALRLTVDTWLACYRIAASACLLIAAQLSPHGLQPSAHLTCGTRATAPRHQPALHVDAPLGPHGRSWCAHTTYVWFAATALRRQLASLTAAQLSLTSCSRALISLRCTPATAPRGVSLPFAARS